MSGVNINYKIQNNTTSKLNANLAKCKKHRYDSNRKGLPSKYNFQPLFVSNIPLKTFYVEKCGNYICRNRNVLEGARFGSFHNF